MLSLGILLLAAGYKNTSFVHISLTENAAVWEA